VPISLLKRRINLSASLLKSFSYHINEKKSFDEKRGLAVERLECIEKEVESFLGVNYYKPKIVDASIKDWKQRGYTILKSVLNEEENKRFLEKIQEFIRYGFEKGTSIGPGMKQIDLLKEARTTKKDSSSLLTTLDTFMKTLATRIENVVRKLDMPGNGWSKIECRFVKLLCQSPFQVQDKFLEGLLHADYETEIFISGIYTLEDDTLGTQIPKESVRIADLKRQLFEKYHDNTNDEQAKKEFRSLAEKLTNMALGCDTYPNVRLNGGDLMLFSSILEHQTISLPEKKRVALYVTFFPHGKSEIYNTDYQFFPWSPLIVCRDPKDLVLLYYLLANLWNKGYQVWSRWDTPQSIHTVMTSVKSLRTTLEKQDALLEFRLRDSVVVSNYKDMDPLLVQEISSALATCLELAY
jgi:hypothetical protein